MYISWQVLFQSFKGKCTPTTDKGYMYATSGPSGAFHVKWHKISETNPVVDRFHVTYESTSDKAYYLLTNGTIKYTGNRPKDGEVGKTTVEHAVGAQYLYEYDDIAKVFLQSVNSIPGKLHLTASDAVADDKAVDKAALDQKDRAKLLDPLRQRYAATPEANFTKLGLTKLSGSERVGKSPEWYEEILAKVSPTTVTPTTPTPSTQPLTTPSSAVFAGTKVPLPPPTGLAVTAGPVSHFKPWNKK